MNIKLAVLTAVCAFLSIGAATAADRPERQPANIAAEQTAPNSPVVGFSSGTGMGAGGGAGSVSSLAGGFGSPIGGSGGGSQTFGGGFNQQQTIGSGPLSTGGGAMGP